MPKDDAKERPNWEDESEGEDLDDPEEGEPSAVGGSQGLLEE